MNSGRKFETNLSRRRLVARALATSLSSLRHCHCLLWAALSRYQLLVPEVNRLIAKRRHTNALKCFNSQCPLWQGRQSARQGKTAVSVEHTLSPRTLTQVAAEWTAAEQAVVGVASKHSDTAFLCRTFIPRRTIISLLGTFVSLSFTSIHSMDLNSKSEQSLRTISSRPCNNVN